MIVEKKFVNLISFRVNVGLMGHALGSSKGGQQTSAA